jgi:hypothetical protein
MSKGVIVTSMNIRFVKDLDAGPFSPEWIQLLWVTAAKQYPKPFIILS